MKTKQERQDAAKQFIVERSKRSPKEQWQRLDAKFGVYVHWTLASVPSWGNHSSFYWPNLLRSRQMESAGPRPPKADIAEEYVGLWDFHRRTYGPDFQFEEFAPLFREKPLFFMVNLATGGGWPVDLSRYDGVAEMYIDYVRVYQGKE